MYSLLGPMKKIFRVNRCTIFVGIKATVKEGGERKKAVKRGPPGQKKPQDSRAGSPNLNYGAGGGGGKKSPEDGGRSQTERGAKNYPQQNMT